MSSHADLVQRACAWLRSRHRCNVILAEPTSAGREIPDAIGWMRGSAFSHVVECKTSRSDFLRDASKIHARRGESMGDFRWYLTPPGLLRLADLDRISGTLGLAELMGAKRVRVIRDADKRPRDHVDVRAETMLLTSAVHRHELGVEWHADAWRFEAYDKTDIRRPDCGAVLTRADGSVRAGPCRRPQGHRGSHSSWPRELTGERG